MAEIIQVATVVRKLFLPDTLPWPFLLAESNLEKLRLRYKFDQLNFQPNDPANGIPPLILGPKGEFTIGGTVFLVEQLILQPSIVQFQLSADSENADKFAADLGEFFLEIDPNRNYSEARGLTKTYQTIAVAKLSVPFEALLSEKLSRHLAETVAPRLAPENTAIDIRFQALRWMVSFRAPTSDFMYLPKLLAIEPRQGSRPSDMLYFTQSPADFETHMKLLESLEEALA